MNKSYSSHTKSSKIRLLYVGATDEMCGTPHQRTTQTAVAVRVTTTVVLFEELSISLFASRNPLFCGAPCFDRGLYLPCRRFPLLDPSRLCPTVHRSDASTTID
jgi:hypothetical protein